MMKTIYFIDGFYGCLTFIAVDATRIVEEQHRRAFRSALNSLVYRRQEATRPHTLSSIRISPARRKNDKSGCGKEGGGEWLPALFPASGFLPPDVSTTNPGRLLFSLPNPYVTQEPMLGRPNLGLPVCSNNCAGA